MVVVAGIEAFCMRLWYNGYWYLDRGILYTPLVRQRDVLIVLLGPKILSVVATWGYDATMLHAAWGRRHQLAGYISEQFKSRDGYLSFEGGC